MIKHTVIVAALLVVTACGGADPEPTIVATPTPTTLTPTPTPTPTTTPTPTPTTTPTPQLPTVAVNCGGEQVRIVDGDFSEAWDGEHDRSDCDEPRRNSGPPLSKVEQEALVASGYEDRTGLTTLYGICARVDPDDTYTSGEHAASPEQADEIDAALILCPDHPLADEMQATADRGRQDAEWEASGRLFRTGTFLVGDEIQPGTYVIERDEIENCYWERQNSTGGIIENRFILGARRVEVTIRSSDYAFHNQGCGTWRPSR